MKKVVTFTIGKKKEKVDVHYDVKPTKEIQKIMKKLSKENPNDDISAHWNVDSQFGIQIGGFDFLSSYNYRQEEKTL